MSDLTPDKLRSMLMEAYVNQVKQFRQDLEVRIAMSLKVNSDLPQATVVPMAVAVSTQLAEMVEGVTMIEADKIIRKAL